MIAKKNWREELRRKRINLMQVGMLTSTSLMLAAFTYETKSIQEEIIEFTTDGEDAIEYVHTEKEEIKDEVIKEMDIPVVTPIDDPITDPVVGSAIDLTKITIGDNTNRVPGPIVKGPIGTPPTTTIRGKEKIIEIPTVDAAYPGGYTAMMEFIQKNVEYPEDAMMMGVQGKVYLSFIVEKDGRITDVKVVEEKKVSPSIDAEAKRVVRSFPNWIPGEFELSKVRTRVVLPITFKIGK